MSTAHPPAHAALPAPKGKRRRRVWCLVFLLVTGFFVWFAGPGSRWLIKHQLMRLSQSQGAHLSLDISGNLWGGYHIRDLSLRGPAPALGKIDIQSLSLAWSWGALWRNERLTLQVRTLGLESQGPLAALTLAEADIQFRPQNLPAQPLEALRVHGLDAHIELLSSGKLAKPSEKPPSPASPNHFFDQLARFQKSTVPIAISTTAMSLRLSRVAKPVLEIQDLGLEHVANSEAFDLSIGSVRAPDYPPLPEQKLRVVWSPKHLAIPSCVLPFGWSAADLEAQYALAAPTVQGAFHFQNSRLWVRLVDNGQQWEAGLDGAALPLQEAIPRFISSQWQVPKISGQLEALAFQTRDWSQAWQNWSGTLMLQTRDLDLLGWNSDSAKVSAHFKPGQISGNLALALPADIPADGKPEGNTKIDTTFDVSELSADGKFRAGVVTWQGTVQTLGPLASTLIQRNAWQTPGEVVPEGDFASSGRIQWDGEGIASLAIQTDISNLRAGAESLGPLKCKISRPQRDAPWGVAVNIPREASQTESTPILSANLTFAPKDSHYTAQLTAKEFDLAHLAPWQRVLLLPTFPTGRITIDWTGSGIFSEHKHHGKGTVSMHNLAHGAVKELNVQGEIDYDWPDAIGIQKFQLDWRDYQAGFQAAWKNNQLTFDALAIQHLGKPILTGNARVPVPANLRTIEAMSAQTSPWSLDLEAPAQALSEWEKLLPATQRGHLTGDVGARIKISGSPAHPEILFSLAAGNVVAAVGKVPPVTLEIQAKSENTASLRVTANARADGVPPLGFDGQVPFQPWQWLATPKILTELPLSGKLSIPDMDLSQFSQLIEKTGSLKGKLAADITLSGTTSKPGLRGKILATECVFTPHSDSLPEASAKSLGITFDDTLAKIETSQVRVAGGTTKVAGTIDYTRRNNPVFDLTLHGNHMLAWRDEAAIVRLSPSLRLAGDLKGFAVTGEVKMVESLFAKDFEIIPLSTPFTAPQKPVLPRFDAPVAPANLPAWFAAGKLDVRFYTKDAFLIRGNLARGHIEGELKIGGTLGKPAPLGTLELRDLEARLPFSDLSVRRGFILFSPDRGLSPELAILGTSQIDDYTVNLNINGPADNPRIVLTSDPPLPDNEILTLLASGTTSSELTDRSSASGRALMLLVEELRRGRLPFGKKLGKLLEPLSKIRLEISDKDSFTGSTTSSASIKLTDRWLLSAAVDEDGNPSATLTFLIRLR